MVPELHYYRAHLAPKRVNLPQSIIKQSFNLNVDPFQGGYDPLYFKKSLIGSEDALLIQGQKISELTKKCIPEDLSATKDLIEKEMNKIQTTEETRERLRQSLEKLDEEIQVTTKHNLNEITQRFDRYLADRLDPQNKMSPQGFQNLKDRVTSLFSMKALTAFSAAFDIHSQKKLGGIFMARITNKPTWTCNLILPENLKAPIQVIAKMQTIYQTFLGKNGMQELREPVTLEATATYTIQKNGKVGGQATATLRDLNQGISLT